MTPERYRQIERVYHEAMELPPDQRAVFIIQACAGDEELRDEVESLIRAGEQAPGSLPTSDDPQTDGRIGRYRILELLGAGGMGEVYLARDDDLRRKVAIKRLLPEFTADPDHVRRFKQEAIAASALNHPNIVTIYEIGQSDDSYYITMEYIEGKTLRQLLAGEPLEVPPAVDVAEQIAAALAAAHEAGIVHRDVKPENVMIRPDRLVKVLDFGLAKLIEQRPPPGDTSAPTGPALSTDFGKHWITPAYMSPERARGLDVDARTDIFSLGVVLYEMLAGYRPFTGPTAADLRAAILEKEPRPLAQRAPSVPARLERIVNKALVKDRAHRYQTIKELQSDLRTLRDRFQSQARLGKSLRRAVFAFGLLTALITTSDVPRKMNLSGQDFPTGPQITEIVNQKIGSGGGISRPAVSPDGRLIAYSLNSGGASSIWVKQLAGGDARIIAESKWGDRNPIWSPDGEQLAFISNRGGRRGIWSIPYMGGTTTLLQEVDPTRLIAWSRSGRTIYYEVRPNLYALDLGSGQITQLTNFDPNSSRASEFSMAPDEEKIAYRDSTGGTFHILVAPLSGGEPKAVTRGKGHDLSPSWFSDSNRIAFRSNRTGSYQIYLGWLDLREPVQVTSGDDDYDFPVVSPDGRRIISTSLKENANISSCDVQTGQEVTQTQALGLQLFPEVSPDGEWMAFQSSKTRIRMNESISIKSTAAGGRPPQLLCLGFDPKWSPERDTLAFLRYSRGKYELWKVSADSANEKLLTTGVLFGAITDVPYNRAQTNYSWSPDGTKIAYCSEKSGQWNLWIVSQDGSSDMRISENTDPRLLIASPLWSPDGNRIAYVSNMSTNSPSERRESGLWIAEQGSTRGIFQHHAPLRLIGWSASGDDIYVALSEQQRSELPQDLRLARISRTTKKLETIARIRETYLHNLRLSPDSRRIALVSRQDGKDNVNLVSTSGGQIRKITPNNDPTVYYSGLAWSHDGRELYYSKQTSWTLILMIENFN